MDDAARAKARETRAKNEAARIARREADAALKQAEKAALKRIFENPDATPAEILEAARRLAEIEKY